MYEQWADITVDCDGHRLREVVADLKRQLGVSDELPSQGK